MNILLAGQFDPGAMAELQKHHTVWWAAAAQSPPDRLSAADVLVTRGQLRVDRSLLDVARRLRLIVKAGAGLDTIDLETAFERGIRVETTPVGATSVAELALCLLLTVRRHVTGLDRRIRTGDWNAKYALSGRQLKGSRLGIVGFGRIGRELARLAHGVGMDVVAWDRAPGKEEKRRAAAAFGVRFLDLAALLTASDAISLHLPSTPSTRGLIGADELALLPPGAILVNTGRASVVDREAFVGALQRGSLAGAGLDVFWTEPMAADDPLFQLPNLICTPHVGAQTRETMADIGWAVVETVRRFEADLDSAAPRSVTP
jgi:D-3-phosphoglycerate dehydrogenase